MVMSAFSASALRTSVRTHRKSSDARDQLTSRYHPFLVQFDEEDPLTSSVRCCRSDPFHGTSAGFRRPFESIIPTAN